MADANGNSPAGAVLTALGFALFVREENAGLRPAGPLPEWLSGIDPLQSPFFENFLIDAEEAWNKGGEARARSGPWVEPSSGGSEVTLEATALTVDGRAVLLLERLGEVFDAKRAVLQRARETVIAYQRLNSETQKKEVLLNCIAEEMNGALANVITSLRLIELEKNPARTQQLLGLASRATEQQQALINKILHVFAAELQGLHASGAAVSSAQAAVEAARAELAPQFEQKRVGFTCGDDKSLGVAMDAEHLTRVLAALLENALQNARQGGEVRVDITPVEEAVEIRVCDDGAPLPPDVCEGMFSKTALGAPASEPLLLRLQFCRVAVENCSGEIGYSALDGAAGNCFWIRLPQAAWAEAQ